MFSRPNFNFLFYSLVLLFYKISGGVHKKHGGISKELMIKVPNVVMVFSNTYPSKCELAPNRWKIFSIMNEELVEEEKEDHPTRSGFTNKKKKVCKQTSSDYDSNF